MCKVHKFVLLSLTLSLFWSGLIKNAQALCYNNNKFPMTLQQSAEANAGEFTAVTGDLNHLYIGGKNNVDTFTQF